MSEDGDAFPIFNTPASQTSFPLDGDLFSAINNSIAQGEASRRNALSPLSTSGQEIHTITATTNGHVIRQLSQQSNGHIDTHAAPSITFQKTASSHATPATLTANSDDGTAAATVFDRAADIGSSSQYVHTATAGTALNAGTPMTNGNSHHQNLEQDVQMEEPFYAPMSDSEADPDETAQAGGGASLSKTRIIRIPCQVELDVPVEDIPAQAGEEEEETEDRERSASVSYVDQDDTNLAEEQDEELDRDEDDEGMDVDFSELDNTTSLAAATTTIATATATAVPHARVLTNGDASHAREEIHDTSRPPSDGNFDRDMSSPAFKEPISKPTLPTPRPPLIPPSLQVQDHSQSRDQAHLPSHTRRLTPPSEANTRLNGNIEAFARPQTETLHSSEADASNHASTQDYSNSTSLARKVKEDVPSSPVDGGWGISGHQAFAHIPDTYEEVDELADMDDMSSPRGTLHSIGSRTPNRDVEGLRRNGGAELADSIEINGLDQLKDTPSIFAETMSPDKGTQRAAEDDTTEVNRSPDKRKGKQRALPEEAERVDEEPDEQVSRPSNLNKGKQRAADQDAQLAEASSTAAQLRQTLSGDRSWTPPGRADPFADTSTNTPSTVAGVSSTKVPIRPAAVGRSYKKYTRLVEAACLGLQRKEAFLDVSMDHNDACWIRCIHWSIDLNDLDADDYDAADRTTTSNGAYGRKLDARAARNQAPTMRNGNSGSKKPRSSRKKGIPDSDSDDNANATGNDKTPQIICQAEVLAELVDAARDKWKVVRMEGNHSQECDIYIADLDADNTLAADQFDMQGEDDDDLELREALSLSQQPQKPVDADAEIEQAIAASLEDTRAREYPCTCGQTHIDPDIFGGGSNPAHQHAASSSHLRSPQRASGSGTSKQASASKATTVAAASSEEDDLPPASEATGTTGTATGQSFLQRLFNSFTPSTRTIRQAVCRSGYEFSTRKEFLNQVAADLLVDTESLVIRRNKISGKKSMQILCPHNSNVTVGERFQKGLFPEPAYNCPAFVDATQRAKGEKWVVGKLHTTHSKECNTVSNRDPYGRAAAAPNTVHAAATDESAPAATASGNVNSLNTDPPAAHEHSIETVTSKTPSVPIITKLMTFENVDKLKETACRALEREATELDIKAVPHPVFRGQETCNFYCKNYAFAPKQADSRGWSALVPRLGLGGGAQASNCMAFVESSKTSYKDPWRIGHFNLEHGVRCKVEYYEKQTATADSTSGTTGHANPISGNGNGPSGAPSASRRTSPEQYPLADLNDAGPAQSERDNTPENDESAYSSDIGPAKQSAPSPPVIHIGDRYTPERLLEMAQALSTHLSKDSRVVWTQKLSNPPKNIACINGYGNNRDKNSNIHCDFRISCEYSADKKLIVERIKPVHSSACKTATKKKPSDMHAVEAQSAGKHSGAARKTGVRVPYAPRLSQPDSRRPEPDVFRQPKAPSKRTETQIHVGDEAGFAPESSQAAQRRASQANSYSTARNISSATSSRHSRQSTKPRKRPDKPVARHTYDNIHELVQAVTAYSKYKSPHSRLKTLHSNPNGKGKGQKGVVSLVCDYPDCAFRVTASSLLDPKGRELEGISIHDADIKHSRDCRHADEALHHARSAKSKSKSKSISIIEIGSSESSGKSEQSDEDEPPTKNKKRKLKENERESGSKWKRRKIADSDEDTDASLPLPPPLQENDDDASPTLEKAHEDSPQSSPAMLPPPLAHSPPTQPSTPEPFVQRQGGADENMEDFFASVRSTIKPEPQSPVRPNAETRLYTGQMFDSRDEFVDAVHSHTEERNPGCRLAVAHTDPARVRVYCMRPDCEYSFNSVYEHGARGVPGIRVTANNRNHSTTCLAYYRAVRFDEQRVYFDPPTVDQVIEDWHDFESAVQAHTESVNPGCELKTTTKSDSVRVYCPHRDLGCKYSFSAKYEIPDLQEGRVTVTSVRSDHSEGCLDHHRRIAEEEAEEEEALNPDLARKRAMAEGSGNGSSVLPPALRGPGPHVGHVFEDEDEFKEAVKKHSEAVNPGSLLDFKRPGINNVQMSCRYWHTGCRYEFYGAQQPPDNFGNRRITVTDITPDHHEMCVAELVLKHRRPAVDDGSTVRTRRGRLSLATQNGESSKSSQTGTSPNGRTAVLNTARKTTQRSAKKTTSHSSRTFDSDSDSSRVPLRESNLMSHTSMNIVREAAAVPVAQPRVGRPPLIPPSLLRAGVTADQAGPNRPVKRARFEGFRSSSPPGFVAPAPVGPYTEPEHTASSSQSNGAPSRSSQVDLATLLPPNIAEVLASGGCRTVADFARIGITAGDWPAVQGFIASCSPTVFQQRMDVDGSAFDADPLEEFLLHYRLRMVLEEEAAGEYLNNR